MNRLVAFAVGGAAIAVLAAPQLRRGSKTDDRLAALEDEVAAQHERWKKLDAKVVNLGQDLRDLDGRISAAFPREARWLRLEPGQAERWDLPDGSTAFVKFLRMSESGLPVLQLESKAVDAEAALSAGTALQGVDDRGTEKRVTTLAAHELRLDRDGRPDAIRVSVRYAVER
jgi:hypothetical protein